MPQYGNLRIFLSLRFYVKSILPFCHFWGSEFRFLWIFSLFKGWNLPIWQNSEPLKWQKMADFALLDPSKLVSRKIWMTENSWNFHSVQPTVRFPESFATHTVLKNEKLFSLRKYYVKPNMDQPTSTHPSKHFWKAANTKKFHAWSNLILGRSPKTDSFYPIKKEKKLLWTGL